MTAVDPRQRVVLDTNTVIGAGSRWLASEPPAPVSPLQRLVYCVASRPKTSVIKNINYVQFV